MNKGHEIQEIHRAVFTPSQLSRVPMINGLDKPIIIEALIRQGLSMSPETDMEWEKIHLKPGDTVYVPEVEPGLMRESERQGHWPKKHGIKLARYTFVNGEKTDVDADSDILYPWRNHDQPKRENKPVVDPRLRRLEEIDEHNTGPALIPEKVFFTADTHFYDQRVLRFRPRYKDIDEMNEELIRRWNETVPPDGVVFHLGDFMVGSSELVTDLVNRLNGTILLIKGNHDELAVFRSYQIKSKTKLIMLGKERVIGLNRHKIIMNHYPFLCYAGQYSGVWQLFGHVHSGHEVEGYDLPKLANLLPNQYDVGVDNNDDRPIPFTRLEDIMARRDPVFYMKVRRAGADDTDEIQQIAADALNVMREHGNTEEWDEDTFSKEILEKDIEDGNGFAVTERGEVVGYYALSPGKLPPGSEELPWMDPEKPFQLLERVVRYPDRHRVMNLVTGHCFSRFDNVRFVTSRKNVPMLRAARKEHFRWIGEYTDPDGREMAGMQKILQK